MTPLIDLAAPDAPSRWRHLDDVVMGGVSSSQLEATDDGTVVFTGLLSPAFRGGFASVRQDVGPVDLSGHLGLELRVRGDGRTYVAVLRVDGSPDGVSWQARFTPAAGRWTTLRLPFSAFQPRWRGWVVGEAGTLDVSAVRAVGLLIADKQTGSFRLEVSEVGAYTGWPAPVRCAPLDALRWERRLLVVSDPRGDGPNTERQAEVFCDADGEAVDRELSLLVLDRDAFGHERGRLDGEPLSASPDRLRARLGLPADAWAVALVGYDGQVKARHHEPVAMDSVFERIDGMSMRRAEVLQPHRRGA